MKKEYIKYRKKVAGKFSSLLILVYIRKYDFINKIIRLSGKWLLIIL